MTEAFAGGQQVCLGGEELIEQASVQFGIEVGAVVLDNHPVVIGVGGFAEGGEYDAAGGDAEEDGATAAWSAPAGPWCCGEDLLAAKRRLRVLTSGRLGRKPTCTWMMRIPETRARCRMLGARVSSS